MVNIADIPEIENNEEQYDEQFTISDASTADWAIEQIKQEQDRMELFEDVIKTEESVMWGELKKTLSIQMIGDSPVVINQDGEIVDCVKVEETLPEVVVK